MTLLQTIRNYFSLVTFSHTIFAMPFAFIGFTLGITSGDYHFSIRLFLLIILCMISARNAAMGFNRVADLRFDSINPRTMARDIPAGRISRRAGIFFVVINSLLFIVAAGFINRLTLYLSPVALAVILGYSLTKRITALCHFILGLGLSLAPIGAYISVTGRFDLLPVLFSLIVITWVSGFDIIYSLQDDEFDRINKLHSIPSAKGRKNAIKISAFIHLLTIILVVASGLSGNGGTFFWIGALIFGVLLIYQHLLVRPDNLSRVNLAFATLNGVASIIFAAFVITDLLV